MIVSSKGDIIEAVGSGVRCAKLSDYTPREYHLVSINKIASERDRKQVVEFATWCLPEPYGIITTISIALSLFTGGKFNFGFDGQQICSGLVARALERTSVIFNRTPSHIMPADLAKYFRINPPKTGMLKRNLNIQ